MIKQIIFIAILTLTSILTLQANNSTVPSSWRWDTSPGKNLLTYFRQKNNPFYCDASWAFAATSSLNDRIKIMRNGQSPDIILAPQVLLSCDKQNKGCDGGSALKAYHYIQRYNITEESCALYRALDSHTGLKCANTTICKDCAHGGSCFIPESYYVYTVTQIGTLDTTEDIIEEIYRRGPITCSVKSNRNDNWSYFEGKNTKEVSVFGYEITQNKAVLFVRSDTGAAHVANGYYTLPLNDKNVTLNCSYAVPLDTWTNGTRHYTTKEEINDPYNDFSNKGDLLKKDNTLKFLDDNYHLDQIVQPHILDEILLGQHIYYGASSENQNVSANLPENFDWRNINGTNYASIIKNQHIPVYCGSCWAHGSTSALTDRFQIMNGPIFTPISLSVQTIVNCQPDGSSCRGGSSIATYAFIKKNGIPEESCQNYIARNSKAPLCTAEQKCKICDNPFNRSECEAVKNYKNYYVSDYGRAVGVDAMKSEIFHRGPMACSMYVTDKFRTYNGGVYDEDIDVPGTNHVISILGWGVENGTEFWIARNSWGTNWGERGFFRFKMHKNLLNLEKYCVWAVPSYSRN